jgi:hypothetical protein
MSAEEMEARVFSICLLESAALYKPCVKDSTQFLNDLAFVCGLEVTVASWFAGWAGIAAASACYAGYRYDMGRVGIECRADVEESQESCY